MKVICDICGTEMKTDPSKRIVSTKKYRIRRFECEGCGYQQTIYADGKLDLDIIPQRGIDIVKINFKRESKNREL